MKYSRVRNALGLPNGELPLLARPEPDPRSIIAQLAQLRDKNAERENRDNEHGRWEDWGLGYEQALTDIARLCGTDLETKGRPQS